MFIQRLKNIYHALCAFCASLFYGFPGKKLKVIGITGTDGKTTTTHLVYHILKTCGKRVSMISSVYAQIAGKQFDTGFHVTSPDPWMLQKFLKEAVLAKEEYLVLEVTSHGLDQSRILGVNFQIGVLTNITHEHLDYHKTYKEYLKTKEKLLKNAKISIVNKDNSSFGHLNTTDYVKCITYGIKEKADFTPAIFPFNTSLPGEYNRYNCLAAVAATRLLGIEDNCIRKALKSFAGVKGRFEKIPTKFGFEVIIDFAHTPNSVDAVLGTLRPIVKGKIIHVFGAAALRDVSKRPVMGENSAKYSDILVLTEEDYRTEDVNKIIDEIAKGAVSQGAQVFGANEVNKALKSKSPVIFKISNRQEAISFAISHLAKRGDTVILTGKAHEKSLARGNVEYPWSEHEAVKKALEQKSKELR